MTDEETTRYPFAIEKFIQANSDRNNITYYAPKTVILAYQTAAVHQIKKKLKKVDAVLGDLYVFKKNNEIGILTNFGIGGAITSTILETLVVLNVENFILIGTAGGLSNEFQVGEISIPTISHIDEGISGKYIPDLNQINADEDLMNEIKGLLTTSNFRYTLNRNITSETPFKLSETKVNQCLNDGISTIEMETSVLFSIAKYHDKHAVAIHVISDFLDDGIWKIDFNNPIIMNTISSILVTFESF